MVKFKNDNPRLRDEFYSRRLDYRIRAMLKSLAGFVEFYFKKDIIITCLLRTDKEQDKIYSGNERYKIKSWKSVHQVGRGADVRVDGDGDFTELEETAILDFINKIFPYEKGNFKAGLVHNVGAGRHLHLQVKHA